MTNCLFSYVAYDEAGKKVIGEVSASDQKSALIQVSSLGLHPIDVKPLSSSTGYSFGGSNKVSNADIAYFTNELALLLESGVRVDKALAIIAKAKAKPPLAIMLSKLLSDVKRGTPLNKSLEGFPDFFDNLYINLVSIGESTGNLPLVFRALADDMEFKTSLRRKVIQSLTYPSVILFVCFACMYFVFSFIVPQMSNLFENVQNLPWYTSVIISISDWITSNQMLLIFFLISIVFSIVWMKQQNMLGTILEKASKAIPIVGSYVRMVESIRFNSSMAMMLGAGLLLDKALSLAIGSLKQASLRKELSIATSQIKKGESLTSSLSETSLYSDIYASLLEVGEASGNLERVFTEISNRERASFESWISRMTALLEPVLIVFMGLVVGGVVVAMMMSMVSVNDVSF